ncbi:membrane protein insertase YidC [Actinoplanes sp. TRM 88003]|uniref:Membrane protein insertase YidC n=1 Tax=Paractinoplanes aksuensis TaxID=2939490 RepID=A0ABT1E1I5_9ACTN|nr:membrane protein insertase YidC [Actinoplanes aksuensis]MCO8276870.1 membrane protein insertase YidC [Actinoplanes aksuensis]
MSIFYSGISALLIFWHSVWDALLGAPHLLSTDWSWVLGIVFLVVTVRVALLPLYIRQYRSQQAIQRLQPEMRALQQKHQGDAMALSTAMSALYKREKVSPYASFLPLIVQIPVFLALFHVLRHLRPTITDPATQTLYGWTAAQFHDASHALLLGAPLASSFSSGGATMIVAAVLIAAMVTTTFLTTRLSMANTPPSDDPTQRMVRLLMTYGIPLSLLVSGVIFPVGVLLYWTTQNVFALGQQAWLMRRHPPVKAPATAG